MSAKKTTEDEPELATDDQTIEDGTEPTQLASLAELTGALGHKIETIEGKQVIVIGLRFDTRDVRALRDDPETGIKEGDIENREVVQIIIRPVTPTAADPDDDEVIYSFSKPLIQKLHMIQPGQLPAVGTFRRIEIMHGPSKGNRVWSIE